MDVEKFKRRHPAQIASLIPGRLRLKLHPKSRDPALMHGLQRHLQAQQGVHAVRVSPASGSVTVNYNPQRQSPAGILGVLEDLDVVVGSLGELPTVATPRMVDGDAWSDEGFLAAVDDLSQRLTVITGFPINLRSVLPLTFAGAGLWSIGKNGLMIESVPGWLLLWLAFDLFVKLHPADR